MLKDLREELPLSLFQEVSSEDFWIWENGIFTMYHLTDMDKYSVLEKYQQYEKFKYRDLWLYGRLETLKKIWVIKEIQSEIFSEIPDKYNNPNNCTYLFTRILKYDIAKLEILKQILHHNDTLKIKVNRKLLQLLLSIYTKYKDKENNPFNYIILNEELKIEDDKYIFYDSEILIYSICIYRWEAVKKLVNSLKPYLTSDENRTLKNFVENDDKIDWKIFWYEKKNKEIFINHWSKKYKIKDVELNSDYSILWDALQDFEDWVIKKDKIKKIYKIDIDSLSDTKKHLNFKKILNKIFFEESQSNKLKFNAVITQEILDKNKCTEKDVIEYLEVIQK